MIFLLVQDFADALAALPLSHSRRRILALLDEAIRRDVHFIDRHPTTLFQCLWNSCWWYDCPEAAQHYDPPNRGWPAEGPPWEGPGPRLCALIERWRKVKEGSQPGFVWLRSLIPPRLPLAASQLILHGHEERVECVEFSPDGARLASSSADKTVRLWDAASGQELACLRGHEEAVSSVSFSPDGRRLASASGDRTLRLWDAGSGQALACLRGHESWVNSVVYSPDGHLLASASSDKTVRVWDATNGQEIACLRGHEGPVQSVSFSPDGRRLASGSDDHAVRVWEVGSGRELACLRGHGHCVSFLPDRRRFATAGWETVWLWDAASGQELACLRGLKGQVGSVSFSPDGSRLASASDENTVRLWDADGGQELACLRGHDEMVMGVSFSPDGRHLASASWDKSVRLWGTVSTQELHYLRRVENYEIAASYFPGSVVALPLETEIHSPANRKAMAWFPEPLEHIAASPAPNAPILEQIFDLFGYQAEAAKCRTEMPLGEADDPRRFLAGRVGGVRHLLHVEGDDTV